MEKNKTRSVKREIISALMKMMAEKPYMDITVTDLINKAGVARASFYRNFSSINDVLDALVDRLSDGVIENVLSGLSCADETKWRDFLINHFKRFLNRKSEMAEIRFENLPVLFNRLNSMIEKKNSSLNHKTIKDKYSAVAKTGLINSITWKWMESGAQESPEKMADYIMSFITLF